MMSFPVLLLTQPLIQALIPSHLLCFWSLIGDLPTLAFKYFPSHSAFYFQIHLLKLLPSGISGGPRPYLIRITKPLSRYLSCSVLGPRSGL